MTILRTIEATLWHEESRGFFEVASGTPAEVLHDLGSAGLDPATQQALQKLHGREAAAGADPVFVLLAGRVRVVPRCLLTGARPQERVG